MDNAVALVQAYLRVNGFLTVTEYPILHRRQGGRFQEVTDIDILACRFPEAGRVLPRPRLDGGQKGDQKMDNDPVLDLEWGRSELLVAEVKEGIAGFNPALFRTDVLYEALRRFGFSDRSQIKPAVQQLRENGEAFLADGTRIRLVAFGSQPPDLDKDRQVRFVSLGHVIAWLRGYIRRHWEVHAGAGFREPGLDFLALLEKAENGVE